MVTPAEHQVEQKTSGPTVAVDEGVNALEFAVQSRQLGRNVLSGDPGRPDRRAEGVDDFRQRWTSAATSPQAGGVIPPEKAWMSCRRKAPGPSSGPASRCGATSHTLDIAT